jgi:glycine/D-amino acid oxidase-like deaminating enzyme
MPTKYGHSFWIDQFPKSRVPVYPRHNGRTDTSVVIVGGGLTGCATAYTFAAAGIKVTLVEAGRIGGASGASTGWLGDDPGASFVEVEKAVGLRAARHAWQAWRRAALDCMTLVRRLDLKCSLRPCPAFHVATTPEQATLLKREYKARRDAGIELSFASGRTVAGEVAIDAAAAMRTRDGATLDPYRATIGLAAAAAERGAQLFVASPATHVHFTEKYVEVKTAGGTIRADRVVIATGVPTQLFKSLVRHFWFKTAYVALTDPVPAKIRKNLGRLAAVVRDSARPRHVVRWVDDQRLLVAGADSDPVPSQSREKTIVQRTGQLMYELSTIHPDISGIPPAYGWDAPYARTADGLPYIGPHRNYPRHLFAFGDASHGVTGAYLASRILLRYHLDAVDPADEAFAFTR